MREVELICSLTEPERGLAEIVGGLMELMQVAEEHLLAQGGTRTGPGLLAGTSGQRRHQRPLDRDRE